MSYLVFDSETQTNKSYKRVANPFDDRNYVVLRGWKKEGDTRCSWARFSSPEDEGNFLPIPDDVDVLVGHNIKFDLLYEMQGRNPHLHDFFNRGGRIWCTQYAEYLLRAQEQSAHMCSLDSIIESYGGRTKVDGIKALWEAGVQTSDIDEGLLLDYLVGTEGEDRNSGDVGNTELVYLGQIEEAKENGMLNSIMRRMDGLCATIEMEFNGLKIDIDRAHRDLYLLSEELEKTSKYLDTYIAHIPEEVGFSWSSNVHTSCILFGGDIRYKKRSRYLGPDGEFARKQETASWPLFGEDNEPVDPAYCTTISGCSDEVLYEHEGREQNRFKGGKNKGQGKFKQVKIPGEFKTRLNDFFYELPGYVKPDQDWITKNTTGLGKPVYKVGSETLSSLQNSDIPFVRAFANYKDLTKEIGTYYCKYDESKKTYVGMLTCVQPPDKIIHHSINHCNTTTTRTSGANPNCQNIPRGDKSNVKAMFVSRFGDDGLMLEADYSQLEIVVLALLSGDKNMAIDLDNNVDFHCKRVALKNNISYEDALVWCKDEGSEDHERWKTERTKCKIFSFQRAYGAGPALIARETGMTEEEVKKLIQKEEETYSGVVSFNNAVEKQVARTAEPFRDKHRGFKVYRTGTWQAPTGTLYQFRSYDAPSFLKSQGITDTFKPTEMKNYPVQGTGGEVVQMALGCLWRLFTRNSNYGGKAFLVNTVHDCVWVDVHKDVVEEVSRDVKHFMESIPKMLEVFFGMNCKVKFPVEVEVGENMLDLKHYKI